MAEDPRVAAVVDQQRREQADERRLSRAVLAEDGDALATGDGEGDVGERRPRTLARESARFTVAAPERLQQVANLHRGDVMVGPGRQFDCGWCKSGHAAPSKKGGTEDGNRRARRCADLNGAAGPGKATEVSLRDRVHHVREQHGPRRLGARSGRVKCRA
jgi:hypothetical protein